MHIDDKIKITAEHHFNVDNTVLRHRKYMDHNCHATGRGFKSNLSFSEYLNKVCEAGLSEPVEIGRNSGDYQLGRTHDGGNYTVNNLTGKE